MDRLDNSPVEVEAKFAVSEPKLFEELLKRKTALRLLPCCANSRTTSAT